MKNRTLQIKTKRGHITTCVSNILLEYREDTPYSTISEPYLIIVQGIEYSVPKDVFDEVQKEMEK